MSDTSSIEDEDDDFIEEEHITNIINDLVDNATHARTKKEAIKVIVGSIDWEGLWSFYVTEETKINRIKMLVLFELHGSEFDSYISSYILSFPLKARSLRDNKTVKEENLRNNDELELVRLNSLGENIYKVRFENFEHHISEMAIRQYTSHLPKPKFRPKLCNVILEIQGPEFMCDIRKIMITLIEYSLTLMSTKPNAKFIFDVVRRKLMAENFFISDEMVNKYRYTGANAKRIKFAISSSYNDAFSVHEWLIETKSIDSLLLGIPSSYEINGSMNRATELKELLVLFRQYLRASFKINGQSLDHLLEMGFEESVSKLALRYTGNSVQESVEYLKGNTDSLNDGAKLGLDVGMSRTSDLYKQIMTESEIILPMSKPNVLYSCLSVMDGNSFLVTSIRFPSLMNILNKILSTYYVTRCDMGMKQMMGNIPND